MKKILLLQLGLALAAVMPFAASAQNTETYLRPSYWTPYDQRGLNQFETSKAPDTIPYTGPRIRFGAGFTQQYQNLTQSNDAATNKTGSNRLYPITPGFMTAMANLFTDVQLADGIRLNVTTYLSTRHHNEAWVKGGYIQFDKVPFQGQFWDNLMKIATIKVGHMEINYGDAHFRRSDGGNTIYNPFMDNLIVDAYTTEIGGEVYLKKNGLFGMLSVTNGLVKGNIDSNYVTTSSTGAVIDGDVSKKPSVILKAGYDKQLTQKVRIRVSGSLYHNPDNAGGITLYWGDRTGSNYQNVMEKAGGPVGTALPASTSIPWSGRINPNFSKKVDAAMLNGFIKAGGLELFGTLEHASGRSKTETDNRKMNQVEGEVIYRFGKDENLFIGGRYNTVTLGLQGIANDVTVNRIAGSAGWFVTKNVLMKAEIVNQKYLDFPTTDYRAGGQFKGYVVEAVVGF